MKSRVVPHSKKETSPYRPFIIKMNRSISLVYKVYIYEINTTQSSHNTNCERSSFTGGSVPTVLNYVSPKHFKVLRIYTTKALSVCIYLLEIKRFVRIFVPVNITFFLYANYNRKWSVS